LTLKKYLNLKLIGFGILIWLLSQIEIPAVIRILLQSRIFLIGAALFFMILHVVIKFLRYQYILLQQLVENSFLKTVHFSLAAIYLSFVTPGRIGEISKAYFIHKASGARLNKLLAGSLMDRFFDVYALFLTAIFGLAVINPFMKHSSFVILFLIAMALTPFIFLSKSVRKKLINFGGWVQRKITRADTWSDHLRFIFSAIDLLLNRKLLWGFAATLIAYAFFFGSCYCMSLSLDIPLPYYKIAFFIACANILSFLPISFAGIGTREASLVYLFSIENLSSESALAFSTLVFSFTYLLFGVIGFFCFITLKYDKKSLPNNA